jgi:hypothetical protein
MIAAENKGTACCLPRRDWVKMLYLKTKKKLIASKCGVLRELY